MKQKKTQIKKILMLTSSFPRYSKDMSGQFVFSLAQHLNKLNYRIFVLSPSDNKTKTTEVINKITITRFNYFFSKRLQKVAYGSGIAPNLKKSLLAKIQFPLFFLSQMFSSIKIIKKEKIDIVLSHWIITQGLIGAFMKLLFHKKHILILHGAGVFALKKFFLGKSIAQFIVKYSDRIVTVSAYLKSILDNLIGYDSQAVVCSMGIDTHFFIKKRKSQLRAKMGYSKKQKILLTVGRLIEVKGIQYAIQSMKYFVKTNPDTLLLIIGEGVLKYSLINEVNRLALENNIIFLGTKTADELVNYYNIADILLLPSIYNQWGQTEAFGLVGVEALSCGLPVIGSKIGGIQEFVIHKKNGFLAKPQDSKDIYKWLNIYFSNKKILWPSSKIRNSALAYDWHIIAKKIKQVIEQ